MVDNRGLPSDAENALAEDKQIIPDHRFIDLSLLSLFLALTAVGALLLFWPVAAFVVYQDVDYNNHLNYLRLALNGGSLRELLSYIPHVLFYLLAAGLNAAGLGVNEAALWVAVGAFTAGTLAVFWLLCRWAGQPTTLVGGMVYALAALAALLVMPFNLVTPHNLYLGYIVIHAYHNPTILLLKPFALGVFWLAAAGLSASSHRTRVSHLALVALLGALSVMAKSSYALPLLPALAVAAVYRLVRRRPLNWPLLLAVGMPQVVTLLVQAALFRNTGGLMVAPLAVINQWAAVINPAANQHLPLKFLLSILFPAVVYLLYGRKAVCSVPLNLAWLTFGFGAAAMYLLAESGERLGHANFTWSAQVALWVLFAASLAFFIQQNRSLRWSPRLLLGLLVFGLHLVSGLYWYSLHVNTTWMGDIIANFW